MTRGLNWRKCASEHRVQVVEYTVVASHWNFEVGEYESKDDPEAIHEPRGMLPVVRIRCLDCRRSKKVPNRFRNGLPAWVNTLLRKIRDASSVTA